MRHLLYVIALVIATPLTAVGQVLPVQTHDVQRELREYQAEVLKEYHSIMAEWSAAWERKDARALSQHYTEDAVLYLSDREPLQGRRAIESYFRRSLATAGEARLGVVDFVVSGALAHASGRFTYEDGTASDAVLLESGTYTVLLRREGRRWRIRSHMFRTETG